MSRKKIKYNIALASGKTKKVEGTPIGKSGLFALRKSGHRAWIVDFLANGLLVGEASTKVLAGKMVRELEVPSLRKLWSEITGNPQGQSKKSPLAKKAKAIVRKYEDSMRVETEGIPKGLGI